MNYAELEGNSVLVRNKLYYHVAVENISNFQYSKYISVCSSDWQKPIACNWQALQMHNMFDKYRRNSSKNRKQMNYHYTKEKYSRGKSYPC
jgi:heat shock protein HspQ